MMLCPTPCTMLMLAWGTLTCLIPSAHTVPLPPFDLFESSELPFLPYSSYLSGFSLQSFPTFVNSTTPSPDAHLLTPAPGILLGRADEGESSDVIKTIRDRRLPIVVQDSIVGSVSNLPDWISTLGKDGEWPSSEVDYTTGCEGQKANWPAKAHWQRIAFMAAAWHGGVDGADEFVNSPELLDATLRAMDFWFSNDFTDESCLNGGCDCSSSGLWSTNWFSNVIGVPVLVGQSCLLIGADNMAQSQRDACTRMTQRAVGAMFFGVPGMNAIFGANMLDVARVTIDSGLFTNNLTEIEEGYKHLHDEVLIRNKTREDGIRADGSFSQHSGLLYNGNYGKDYANAVLGLEIPAGGTEFSAVQASPESRAAFEKLWDADLWMMYRNTKTNVLHWDLSALNRMISFPVADNQATGGIQIDLDRVQQLGDLWSSDVLKSRATSLTQTTSDANSGNIVGNRMFYANDYMVQRGPGYVTSLKMYSSRTPGSECTNAQNPYGFHLSDGTLYTYLDGTQYEDIAGAWDWNMIPGTTTDYDATPLTCAKSRLSTKEDFVGGASDGNIGAAAMRYTNPVTRALTFQKAWFFLPNDVQHIMVSQVKSRSPKKNPVISVLDQKRLNGTVLVDGEQVVKGGNFSQATSLWHDSVGYTFEQNALSVDFGARESDWSSIGISTAPKSTVDLFSAWISHGSGSDLDDVPVAYTAYPAVTPEAFEQKKQETKLKTIRNDEDVSAVYDETHRIAMFVFWQPKGGKVTFTPEGTDGFLVMETSGNCAVIYNLEENSVTVSDPSQTLEEVRLTVGQGVTEIKTLDVTLPTGGEAGKSVTQKL